MYGPSEYSWFWDAVRGLFSGIDTVVYFLISAIYQIFFNIANASIIDGNIIRELFSRMQLILGIVVLFKLAITLMNGIINPDTMTDQKNGMGSMVKRIILSLVMIVMIIPLNIPNQNIVSGSYEEQLNNHGILFGTMFEFQKRILSENTIGKIILNVDTQGDDEVFATYGDDLASTILKAFVTVNLKDEQSEEEVKSSEDYATYAMCSDDASKILIDNYNNTNNVRTILNGTKANCNKDYYVFNYSILLSTAVGVLFLVIMVGFTLDIAIRAFKLAILRLIAPVPIIAYIDPKGENNLKTWAQAVLKTYVDLFVRVAIIFLIVFIIQQFTANGMFIINANGNIMIRTFTYLFIILGLFYFAKEAPKFLLESIGIKYTGGLFSGIGKMLGAGAAAVGAFGSARASYQAAIKSDEVNGNGPNTGFNNLKNVGAGILGGIHGFATGMNASVNAKDHYGKATVDAMNKRNQTALNMGAAGSTLSDRLDNSIAGFITGEDNLDILKNQEKILQNQITDQKNELAKHKAIQSRFKDGKDYGIEQARKTGKGAFGTAATIDGNTINMELDAWNRAIKAAEATAAKTISVRYSDGTMHDIDIQDAYSYQSKMEDTANGDYIRSALVAGRDHGDAGVWQRIDNLIDIGAITTEQLETMTNGSLSSQEVYDIFDKGFKSQFGEINNIENLNSNSISKLEDQLSDVQQRMRRASANVNNSGK